MLDDDDRQLLEEVLESTSELRKELRRLRSGELIARLSEADRDAIAAQVYERVDERLAPADDPDVDERAPRRRAGGRGRYFR